MSHRFDLCAAVMLRCFEQHQWTVLKTAPLQTREWSVGYVIYLLAYRYKVPVTGSPLRFTGSGGCCRGLRMMSFRFIHAESDSNTHVWFIWWIWMYFSSLTAKSSGGSTVKMCRVSHITLIKRKASDSRRLEEEKVPISALSFIFQIRQTERCSSLRELWSQCNILISEWIVSFSCCSESACLHLGTDLRAAALSAQRQQGAVTEGCRQATLSLTGFMKESHLCKQSGSFHGLALILCCINYQFDALISAKSMWNLAFSRSLLQLLFIIINDSSFKVSADWWPEMIIGLKPWRDLETSNNILSVDLV